MKKPLGDLKYHEKSCATCRYYRIWQQARSSESSDCLLRGRTLSIGRCNAYSDLARYCDLWKRRPKNWEVNTRKNPHWLDKYYKRAQLEKMRKRLGIAI